MEQEDKRSVIQSLSYISNIEFCKVMDDLIELAESTGQSRRRAYLLVSNQLRAHSALDPRLIRYFHEQKDVRMPPEAYDAALTALKNLERNVRLQKIRDEDDEQRRKEIAREEEKKRKKEESAAAQKDKRLKDRVWKTHKPAKRIKEPPRPNVKPGHVAYFALEALVDTLLEDSRYASANRIDLIASSKGLIKGRSLACAYKSRKDCNEEVYDGLLRLIEDGSDTEEILSRKTTVIYEASNQYGIGQLLDLEGCLGVVVKKPEKGKMLVVTEKGEKRTYTENVTHDSYFGKNERGEII